MRILFVTGEFPPMHGGVGDYTNEIVRRLAGLGVEVRVLTSQAAQEHGGSVSSEFIVSPTISRWNWASLAIIRKSLREFVPDVLHIQYQTGAYGMHPAINFLPRRLALSPPTAAHSAQGQARTRFVTTFHDLRIPYLFPKAGRVRDWVTRELACSSTAVIATDERDYSRLLRWGVRDLSLIPIGSNIAATPPRDYDRQAWRARLGVSDEETLLCYFGFVNPDKGVETLMQALHLLTTRDASRSIRARLLMIGGRVGASDPADSTHVKRIQALVGELGLQERVLWTDYAPAEIVTGHFLGSDVCVLPYNEGATFQHGTLMAALAHAMPIVTTRLDSQAIPSSAFLPSSLPRLEDGENCLIVPPGSPQVLAQAIERLAVSPDLRTKLRQGARALAQHFAWDEIVREHLAAYERLLHEC